MIEFVHAVNGISWPGAIVVGCACLALGIVGFAFFKYS